VKNAAYILKGGTALKKAIKSGMHSYKSILRALFLLIILSPLAAALPSNPVKSRSVEEISVIKIVDGDTLTINYKGSRESIRLIGIDTPESIGGKKARRDARKSHKDMSEILSSGKAAAEYTKKTVSPGDVISVEFDVEKRDRYGRLLGYVFLKDGRMLNEEIIKNGYASVLTIPPNVKYQQRFVEAYRYARKNNLGLWKE